MSIFLFLLGILIGIFFGTLWVKYTNPIKSYATLKGRHFHHSLLFIPLITFAFFFQKPVIYLFIGMGLGIVIQHTLQEGFIFISKKKL